VLSEAVLEELLRNTPMREYLVREAWPDLSTESRLQVIQAMNVEPLAGIPEWLSALALDDTAPIVRYWAASRTYFKRPPPADSPAVLAPLYGRTPSQVDLCERARNDSAELVRLCAACGETLSFSTLTSLPQFQRLAFLRGLSMPSPEEFFEWLKAAISAGVVDRELVECWLEFAALPDVRKYLERSPDDFVDGGDAHHAGKTIEAGWNIARIAGPALQRQLAFMLPTRMGLTTMKTEELATMPEKVLAALPWRTDGSPEIAGVISLIRANPQRFPDEAVKSVDRAEGYPAPTEEERLISRDRQALDRPRATLEAVIRVSEKVDGLADQFQQIRQEQSGRKRGFFG
jgi:hypothetical protein